MRSGLSKNEMDNMPINLFWRLYIFDTYLEPQSPLFKDIQNAKVLEAIYLTAPGMTREASKNIKLSDLRLIRDEKRFKTAEELEELARKEEERKLNSLLSIYDPNLKNELQERLKG